MPGLSEYQNVFRIEKSESRSKGSENRAVTKRNRQPVSCVTCRNRKLKCDRQVPCSSCSKRGPLDATSCSYSSIVRSERGKRDRAGEKTADANQRLRKLEQMVTSLLQSTSSEGSDHTSENVSPNSQTVDHNLEELSLDSSLGTPETCSGARGHLDVTGPETKYLGATHWSAILDNIRDIQVALEPEVEGDEQSPTSSLSCPDILLDTNKSLTYTDVRTTLGERARIDKILSTYFSYKHNQNPILHVKKFMREYESFWADPSSVSFLWISILFSVLHIGVQIIEVRADADAGSSNRSLGEDFLARSGQALVAGGYDKARPYSVESLLLYTLCKHFRKDDQETNTWLMMSVCARMAMRLGYHQDPRHLDHFSPFEAEMRRRTFFTVEALDFLISFQAGLPAVIPEEVCDTEPPSNLFDDDFDEDSKALPSSRPSTEPTPMLYYCYKSRLSKVLRRGFRLALSVKRPSKEQTMELDAELQQIHSDVPPSLQTRPMASCFGDLPYIILHRINLDTMYLKIVCVLHRTYITYERSNPAFNYSRRTCIDAALGIMKYQAEVHTACQPGGLLHNEKWMPSSFLIYDYLLAVMVICLDLFESRKSIAARSQEDELADMKKWDALKLSYDIWSTQKTGSRDARRAMGVLAVMLSRLPRPSITVAETPGLPQSPMNSMNGVMEPSLWEPIPAWNTNEFGTQEFSMDGYAEMDFNFADPLNNIFTAGSENIDWDLIDQCLLGQSNNMDAAKSFWTS